MKKIYLFTLVVMTFSCKPLTRPDYYSQTSYWKKYQNFLPTNLWYSDNQMPEETYWNWKDYSIHIDRMPNENAPVKVVILHGAGGNGRIVGLLGNFIHALGYEYLAPDLIGYGLTKNPKKKNISYAEWVDCVADLITAEQEKDNRPIVLFGLSMGGMLAYQVAAKNPLVKGIIVTTLADPRQATVRDDLTGSKWLSRVAMPIGKITAPVSDHIRVPIRWVSSMEKITNDAAFSQLFAQDMLAGGSKIPLRFLRTFTAYNPALEPEAFTKCKVLYLQPEKDTWTTLSTSKPFYDRINSEKSLIMLENCGHAPFEEPGVSTMKNAIQNFLRKIISFN
jgi:alpha-beta hydrolase superfamily lysophospholipase